MNSHPAKHHTKIWHNLAPYIPVIIGTCVVILIIIITVWDIKKTKGQENVLDTKENICGVKFSKSDSQILFCTGKDALNKNERKMEEKVSNGEGHIYAVKFIKPESKVSFCTENDVLSNTNSA